MVVKEVQQNSLKKNVNQMQFIAITNNKSGR